VEGIAFAILINMKATETGKRWRLIGTFGLPLTVSGVVLSLSGCLVVGYSSRGGAFIWPGGFGLLVLLAVLYFFLRGRG
jgi:hypothetical protein